VDDTQSQPPAAWWAELDAVRAELDQLRRDVVRDSIETDRQAEVTELRMTAIEEILAVRWPRSIGVRRRLARDLRASVAHVEGATFTERRIEAIGSGWIRPLWRQR